MVDFSFLETHETNLELYVEVNGPLVVGIFEILIGSEFIRCEWRRWRKEWFLFTLVYQWDIPLTSQIHKRDIVKNYKRA